MKLSPITDATTTIHYVESPVSALIIPSDISQDAEDEDAADEIAADQATIPIAMNAAPSNEELDEAGSEDASNQTSPLDKQTTAGEWDPEREQGLMEQKLEGQLTEAESAILPQSEFLAADEMVTSRAGSGDAEEGGVVAVASPAKNSATGEERIYPEQSIDRAAALQMNTALKEALEDDTNAGQQQQGSDFDHQLPSSSHTEAAEQPREEDLAPTDGPDSIPDKQAVPLDLGYTDGEEKESAQLESPTRPRLPIQAQGETCKPTALVQDEDTDYLHAFLTRAKAKKAAREASPQKVDRVPPSPMTRSRAALMPLPANSPSPRRPNREQMPLDTTHESEIIDTNAADSPCRRSVRTRLPRPQKAPSVTPSTIPVRRSNGTEFVFLQSTNTAQLALATRTNTKRNKGEAVMPKMKLQALSQAQKSPSKSPKPRKGKEVSWEDEPTYFGVQAGDAEEGGEARKADEKPRARKDRRLGATNGTPAPKKMMAEDGMAVRRPVSRKKGKAKR